MSLNRIKATKSKVALAELKKKIISLQFKLRKVKAEKVTKILTKKACIKRKKKFIIKQKIC